MSNKRSPEPAPATEQKPEPTTRHFHQDGRLEREIVDTKYHAEGTGPRDENGELIRGAKHAKPARPVVLQTPDQVAKETAK